MTSRITIYINDEHKVFTVVWPDGTGHSYKMSPPQTEHSIKNRIADEVNRIMMVPELCSGAGGLQYKFEKASRFIAENNCFIANDGRLWILDSEDGKTYFESPSLKVIFEYIEEITP